MALLRVIFAWFNCNSAAYVHTHYTTVTCTIRGRRLPSDFQFGLQFCDTVDDILHSCSMTEITFDILRQRIRDCLGADAGLNQSDEHLEYLIGNMKSYRSVNSEWERFALGDPSRAYTRNLVDECNGRANLLVLVWNPQKASPVHCHSNAHCLMKVLSGQLQETLYEWPSGASPMTPQPATKEDLIPRRTSQHEGAMTVKRESTLERDDVTYISDALGLHRISNPSETEVAVSLHLYTPPWAARYVLRALRYFLVSCFLTL